MKMLARLELRFSFDSALTLSFSDAIFTLATLSTLLLYHVSNLMAYHVCCLRSVDALYWCLAREIRSYAQWSKYKKIPLLLVYADQCSDRIFSRTN